MESGKAPLDETSSKPPIDEEKGVAGKEVHNGTSKVMDEEKGVADTNIHNGNSVEPSQEYSIFINQEKNFIITMASLAAFIPPVSIGIYYPALDLLAADLDATSTRINLTITAFLIFQGLAPTFIGSLSDETGRRPSYILCFVVFICANIGLAMQKSYDSLFVLRCVQSIGCSGMIALGGAVVADVAISAERGTYTSYYNTMIFLGSASGPFIGGLLCQYLGWRSVFWFLAIFAGVIFLIFLLVVPETCRKVVGNGSIPPQSWNISLLAYMKLRAQRKAGIVDTEPRALSQSGRPNPLEFLQILFDKECGIVLLYAGSIFAGYFMIMAGLPFQLKDKYRYDTLRIGLCFLPAGVGTTGGSLLAGPVVDWNFRRLARKHGLGIDKQRKQDFSKFPIEHARLQLVLPAVVLTSISFIGYGWVMDSRTSIAEPMVLLFVTSFFFCASFCVLNTLILDLNRKSPAGATATLNLARCSLGAGGVAAIIPSQETIGMGWTTVVIVGIWALLSPFLFVVVKSGPRWREEKRLKE